MKKVIYFLVFLSAMVLMNTSCTKPDDDTPLPKVITVNDLVGSWDFQSLTFNGTVYSTKAQLDALDVNYNYIQLSLVNVTTTTLGLLDLRGSVNPYDDDYILTSNQIKFSPTGNNYFLVFSIDNAETFNGTVLKLKLISSTNLTVPIQGIYTLNKR